MTQVRAKLRRGHGSRIAYNYGLVYKDNKFHITLGQNGIFKILHEIDCNLISKQQPTKYNNIIPVEWCDDEQTFEMAQCYLNMLE